MRLLFLALGAIILAGCAMQLPHLPEWGFHWASMDGKSQKQFYEDQIACRREVELLRPPDLLGADAGWGLSSTRAFYDCMKSKGWVRK